MMTAASVGPLVPSRNSKIRNDTIAMSSAPPPSSSSGPLRRSLSVVATPVMAAATWAPAGGPAGAAGAAGGGAAAAGCAGGTDASGAAATGGGGAAGAGAAVGGAAGAGAAGGGAAGGGGGGAAAAWVSSTSGAPLSPGALLVFRGPDIGGSSATLGNRRDGAHGYGVHRSTPAPSARDPSSRTWVRRPHLRTYHVTQALNGPRRAWRLHMGAAGYGAQRWGEGQCPRYHRMRCDRSRVGCARGPGSVLCAARAGSSRQADGRRYGLILNGPARRPVSHLRRSGRGIPAAERSSSRAGRFWGVSLVSVRGPHPTSWAASDPG